VPLIFDVDRTSEEPESEDKQNTFAYAAELSSSESDEAEREPSRVLEADSNGEAEVVSMFDMLHERMTAMVEDSFRVNGEPNLRGTAALEMPEDAVIVHTLEMAEPREEAQPEVVVLHVVEGPEHEQA